MKTLIKDCYVWQWSNETVENLKKQKFHHFDGKFVKKDFVINEYNKVVLNYDASNEKIDRVISLKNKYVLPGFIDAHMHLSHTSELNRMCDLSSCKSNEDVIKELQKAAKEKEEKKKENKNASSDDGIDDVFLIGVGFKSLQTEETDDCENSKAVEVKLDRFILDQHFPDKCVIIFSTCIHYAILNSKALELLGFLSYETKEEINENIEYCQMETENVIKEKDGINVEKNKNKRIRGVLYEQLVQDVYFKVIDGWTNQIQKMENVKDVIENLVKTGLTCIQTCDKNMATIYTKLEDQNNLNIRMFLIEFSTSIFEYLFHHYNINANQKSDIERYKDLLQKVENDEHLEEVEKKLKAHFCIYDENNDKSLEQNNQTNRLFYGNRIKFFCDGSLGGKTCATYYPFRCTDKRTDKTEGMIGEKTNGYVKNYGIIVEPLSLSTRIMISEIFNLRIEFHCIGDRSADFLLNELSSINKNHDRFIIVHAQLLNKAIIEKIKRLNVLISYQPSFLSSDFKYIQNYIHDSYKKYSYLSKSLLNENIVVGGSSDSPVESFAPLIGIFDCMFRNVTKVLPLSYIETFFTNNEYVQKKEELEKNIKNIKNIINNCFEEKEKLTFPEALAIYTITPAYLAKSEFFNETNKIKLGAICDNAEADFVVVDRDISTECEINLLNCRICQTWVGGKLRYENDRVE